MAPLQRGTKLTPFTEIESGVVSMLDDVVCRVMKSNQTFQDFADFTSTVELGYVALMRMPQGSNVERHIDPCSECDLAAIFVFQGAADVTVGGRQETCLVQAGDLYMFEPTKQYHSVSTPIGGNERCAVALRSVLQKRP